MRIDFHIHFSGQCREAFEYYKHVLGGEVEFLAYADSPLKDDVSPEWAEKIIHGSFKLNNLEIAGGDVAPEHYQTPQGFLLLLRLGSEQESRRIFNAFSDGGTEIMPLQKTFWSPCYGIVVDKFGVSWKINYVPEM